MKHIPLKDLKLSVEEKATLDSFESGEMEVIPLSDEEKFVLQQIAVNTLKRKNINMRVTGTDLNQLKQKAAEIGIGYQTIVTALIRQYLSGKIRLEL